MSFAPLNHQISGADYLIRHRWAILADSMGTGKTSTVLLAATKLDLKMLVICPAFLKGVWKAEIEKHFPHLNYFVCDSKNVPKDLHQVTIVNYEHIDKIKHLFAQAGIVAIDEAHYIKNLKAKRTKTLHEYVKKLLPGYLWAMSGTPIKNNIPEFWSILKIMAQCPTQTNGIRVTDEYHNYWEFVSYFCNEVKKKVGRATYRSYDGFKNQRVFKELLRQKMIRRTLADLQLSLPEEVNLIYPVAKLTQEERLKNAYTDYELSKTLPTSTPEKVQAALDKISYTVPVIKGLLEEGNAPVLVLSDYISVAEAIHHEFEKEGSRLVTGNVPPPKRFALCEEFQRGTIPILICTIGSIKEGLTLTAANYAVFNDLCWVPSDLAQVKRRILRIGQTKTCFYYYISAPGIDENITKKLMEKAKILMQSLAISSDSSPYDILA